MNLTQNELQSYYEQGKTQLFQYRRAYQIEFCHGTSNFIARELERLYTCKGLPWTKRGRYVAYNVEQANKLIER